MRIYASDPLTNLEAWRLWEGWYKDDRIHWTDEPSELLDTWKKYGVIRSASPKLWMDPTWLLSPKKPDMNWLPWTRLSKASRDSMSNSLLDHSTGYGASGVKMQSALRFTVTVACA